MTKKLALAVLLLLAGASSALASGKPDDGYYNMHHNEDGTKVVTYRVTNDGYESMFLIDVRSVCTVRCPKPLVKVVREEVPIPVPAPPMIRKTRG